MDRAFLHIGTPKTGTSIIQSHLAQNREVLRDMGYLYPITISADEKLYRTYESHHLLTYSIAGWEPFNRYEPETFFEMAEETAAKHSLKTLLLSAENTYWLPRQIVGRELPDEQVFWDEKRQYVEKIAKYLEPYETDIIVYLRRQDRWIESWFNQQVKNGNALISSMEGFIEHHRWLIDYEKLLGIWGDVFGKDRIKVRVYEKQQLPGGLFADYCKVVGIENHEDLPLRKPARYNAQLNRDALEFMNICNSLELDGQQKWWLRMKVRKVTKQFESQLVFHNQSLLSPDQRADLVERYADMNARIAQEYMGRADGKLFLDPVPDRSEPWEPYPGMSTHKVLEIVMQLLLEMQTELNQLKQGPDARAAEAAKPAEATDPAVLREQQKAADKTYWDAHAWDHQ